MLGQTGFEINRQLSISQLVTPDNAVLSHLQNTLCIITHHSFQSADQPLRYLRNAIHLILALADTSTPSLCAHLPLPFLTAIPQVLPSQHKRN